MTEPTGTPILVTADTSGFEAAMRDISAVTERFGDVFAGTMRRAVLSGRDLDDTLRSIGLRFADLALSRALAPLENAIAGLVGGALGAGGLAQEGSNSVVSAAQKIVFNVTSPDTAGFAKSEAQITAMLARAVGRGQRAL